MKSIYFAAFLLFFGGPLASQQLSKLTLSGTGNLNTITFKLDESVVLNISQDGNIIDWGVDIYYGIENYWGKLEPYTGRTENYRENDNEAFRGKLKYIGRTLIKYYASYEDETLKGKIKSIGLVRIVYYQKYENEAVRGRIKSAGTINFSYYPAFGYDPNTGKLKGVDKTTLTYYSNFDDKAFKGKIKSIGSVPYTYYSSNEARYRGGIKSGSFLQVVNGIKFQIM